MSDAEPPSTAPARRQLEQRIRALDEQLRSELSARGFDPAQSENLALTGPLAKLYMELANLRDELATLPGAPDANEEN